MGGQSSSEPDPTIDAPTISASEHYAPQSLYDDDDLVDFTLRSKEKSTDFIKVHKAVLAAQSEVFRRMLSTEWKEVKQGYVELSSNIQVLEAFKAFIYKRELPKDNLSILQELVLLGSYYMMTSLEEDALNAVKQMTTAKNAYSILEFAFHNNSKQLAIAVLKLIDDKIITANNIEKNLMELSS